MLWNNRLFFSKIFFNNFQRDFYFSFFIRHIFVLIFPCLFQKIFKYSLRFLAFYCHPYVIYFLSFLLQNLTIIIIYPIKINKKLVDYSQSLQWYRFFSLVLGLASEIGILIGWVLSLCFLFLNICMNWRNYKPCFKHAI